MTQERAAVDFATIIAIDTTYEPYSICIFDRQKNKATSLSAGSCDLKELLEHNEQALIIICDEYSKAFLTTWRDNIDNEIRMYRLVDIKKFQTGQSREHMAAAILQSALSPESSYSTAQ